MSSENARILVVDDDLTLLDLLVDTLEAIGYQAVGVPGGFEALDKLKTESFDLIISDIKMPEMDGIELLKRIRSKYPQTPVLFITGVASDEIVGRALPDGFLAKPFRIEHIEEMIKRTLSYKDENSDRPIRRVLVVDDDEAFRDMLSRALRFGGYVPFAVADGPMALTELENGDIDAVITDIRMPGMSGMELLKEIKGRMPDMPVVLVTGHYSEQFDKTDESSIPADAILEKPFRVEAIIELLDRVSSATKK